jgi:hypothetical protein
MTTDTDVDSGIYAIRTNGRWTAVAWTLRPRAGFGFDYGAAETYPSPYWRARGEANSWHRSEGHFPNALQRASRYWAAERYRSLAALRAAYPDDDVVVLRVARVITPVTT